MCEIQVKCVLGITMFGRYEQVASDLWRLIAWKLNTPTHDGGWYKVRANKRKDIGVLKLQTTSRPESK